MLLCMLGGTAKVWIGQQWSCNVLGVEWSLCPSQDMNNDRSCMLAGCVFVGMTAHDMHSALH